MIIGFVDVTLSPSITDFTIFVISGIETNWKDGDMATLYWCGSGGKDMKELGKFTAKDGSKRFPFQFAKDLKTATTVRFGIAVENMIEKQKRIEEEKRKEAERKEAERREAERKEVAERKIKAEEEQERSNNIKPSKVYIDEVRLNRV